MRIPKSEINALKRKIKGIREILKDKSLDRLMTLFFCGPRILGDFDAVFEDVLGKTRFKTVLDNLYLNLKLLPDIDARLRSMIESSPIDALHYVLTRNYWSTFERFDDGESALSALIGVSTAVKKRIFCLILKQPKLDFENHLIEAHSLLKTLIQQEKESSLQNALLSDPRFHRAFQKFSDDQIRELWSALDKERGCDEISEMLAFRIFMHLFEKNPNLTYDEATNQFSNLYFPKNNKILIFNEAKKALTLPQPLIFCFGFDVFMILARKNFQDLTERSIEEQFLDIALRLIKPLHCAAGYFYLEEHRPWFQLLLNSEKIDVNAVDPKSQKTVLDTAFTDGNTTLVALLLTHPKIVRNPSITCDATDLLALTCFVGDGLLTMKDEAQLSDVEKIFAPRVQRFLTMASRIAQVDIRVAMETCNHVYDTPSPDKPIRREKLDVSLKGLGLKYSKI